MNKKYIPDYLTKADKKKQIKSIKEKTNRPFLKSFKSRKSKWNKLAEEFFGEGNTSKEDMAYLLSDGNKKKERELKKGFDEIFDKASGAYYSSGSRPNQNIFSWGYARIFSVLFGGPSRKIDKNIVEKYNIPLIIKLL